MLIELDWLTVENPDLLSLSEDAYMAIDAFQTWYNNVVAESDSEKLVPIRNADGTFTDALGNYNTIDEATYNLIMEGIFYNPDMI